MRGHYIPYPSHPHIFADEVIQVSSESDSQEGGEGEGGNRYNEKAGDDDDVNRSKEDDEVPRSPPLRETVIPCPLDLQLVEPAELVNGEASVRGTSRFLYLPFDDSLGLQSQGWIM